MKVIKESINNIPESDTVATTVDVVMADAKKDSIEAEKEVGEYFDAQKLAHQEPITGHDKKDYPDEVELPKIELDENLFMEANDIQVVDTKPTYANDVEDILAELGITNVKVELLDNGNVQINAPEALDEDTIYDIFDELPYADNFTVSDDNTKVTFEFNYEHFNDEYAPGEIFEAKKAAKPVCTFKNGNDIIKECINSEEGCKFITDLMAQNNSTVPQDTTMILMCSDNGPIWEFDAADLQAAINMCQGIPVEEAYDTVKEYISKDSQNGNAFWLMGHTARAMQECGLGDEIEQMREEAMASDYDNLCKVCDKYIQKCNELVETTDDDFEYTPEILDVDDLNENYNFSNEIHMFNIG